LNKIAFGTAFKISTSNHFLLILNYFIIFPFFFFYFLSPLLFQGLLVVGLEMTNDLAVALLALAEAVPRQPSFTGPLQGRPHLGRATPTSWWPSVVEPR